MEIKYLNELNELINIFKDKNHEKHLSTVRAKNKFFKYKNCEEAIMQLENRRDCLVYLLENFTQKDFEILFCFRNFDRKLRHTLYKTIMKHYSYEFALYDYALTDRHKNAKGYWHL